MVNRVDFQVSEDPIEVNIIGRRQRRFAELGECEYLLLNVESNAIIALENGEPVKELWCRPRHVGGLNGAGFEVVYVEAPLDEYPVDWINVGVAILVYKDSFDKLHPGLRRRVLSHSELFRPG